MLTAAQPCHISKAFVLLTVLQGFTLWNRLQLRGLAVSRIKYPPLEIHKVALWWWCSAALCLSFLLKPVWRWDENWIMLTVNGYQWNRANNRTHDYFSVTGFVLKIEFWPDSAVQSVLERFIVSSVDSFGFLSHSVTVSVRDSLKKCFFSRVGVVLQDVVECILFWKTCK